MSGLLMCGPKPLTKESKHGSDENWVAGWHGETDESIFFNA